MKKIFSLMLVAILMVTLALPALAEDSKNLVRVNGTASVSLQADTATLYLGAALRAKTVEEAQKKNAAVMEKMLKAIEEAGVPKEDIVTSQYNVQILSDHGYSLGGEETSYEVSNVLYVTVKDLSKLSTVLDDATKAGANNIYGLEFSNSKTGDAYEKAMTLAVENAKANAQVLASAAGRTLGGVLRVEDMGYFRSGYGLRNNMDMMVESAKGAAIVSGDVSVTASVVVEFELMPAPLMP